MKTYVIIALVMMVAQTIVCAEETLVQLDKEQAIYAEENVPTDAAVTPEAKQLSEYGNMALQPLEAVKETTNQFFSPRMELLYEAQPDAAEFTAEGPKLKVNF